MTGGGFCGACGQRLDAETQAEVHADCAVKLRLDPARFCVDCGARLDVRVFPNTVTASCRRCAKAARFNP